MLITYRSGIVAIKQGHNPWMGKYLNYKRRNDMTILMFYFHQLRVPVQTSTDYGSHFLNSFLDANHIVWLKNLFQVISLNTVI